MPATIFLGTQGWSYKSWVGTFYPDHTPAEDFLAEYAKRFRAVEIDSAYHVGVRLTEVVEGSWDVLDWVIRERVAEKSGWLK